MKKTRFFALAASLLALGFGFMGCDSGDGEDSYNEETPTTWAQLEGTATTSVTAKWTFETDTLPIGTAEASLEGKEIPANSGTGATLVGGNGLGIKWVAPTGTLTDDMGASTGRIQASNKTASLETPENGAMLLLTTTADTNITVRAKGAGAATSARIFLIRQKGSEENLVYKDNLYSAGSKFIAFHLKNAPAGTYEIYFNGSTISEIDCNSTTTVTEPKAYTSNDDLTLSAAPTETLESLVDTHTFTLTDKDNNEVTASATWTSSDESIATVKAGVVTAASENAEGTVTIRARVGRFYKEANVSFTKCTKAIVTVLDAGALPESAVSAHEKAETDTTPVALTEAEATAFWANESVTKALTPVVINDTWVTSTEVAKVELENFGFDKELPLSVQPKGSVAAASAGGKFGLSWKDGKDGVCVTDGGKGNIDDDTKAWNLATITYKVKPETGSTLKLVKASALSANGKNQNDTIFRLTVGSNPEVSMKTAGSNKNCQSYEYDYSSAPLSISEETTIKVVVRTCRNANSFSLQDLQLFFIK